MATKAQIAANRKNAQKSTGPKTPEGRNAVRLNGLKHGLTSKILVLPGESLSDFENLLDSLEAEHQPATPTEVILVRQMAMASWRLNRILHMEASHYHIRRSELEDNFEENYTNLTESDRHAIIADRDLTLMNFSRYEARLERSFHKNLTALQRLRAQRKSEMTNQSQSQEIPTPAAAPGTAARSENGRAEHGRPADRHPETGNRHPAPCIFAGFESPS
jgi:hypothetical protein